MYYLRFRVESYREQKIVGAVLMTTFEYWGKAFTEAKISKNKANDKSVARGKTAESKGSSTVVTHSTYNFTDNLFDMNCTCQTLTLAYQKNKW